jgi:hypothetical protein
VEEAPRFLIKLIYYIARTQALSSDSPAATISRKIYVICLARGVDSGIWFNEAYNLAAQTVKQ